MKLSTLMTLSMLSSLSGMVNLMCPDDTRQVVQHLITTSSSCCNNSCFDRGDAPCKQHEHHSIVLLRTPQALLECIVYVCGDDTCAFCYIPMPLDVEAELTSCWCQMTTCKPQESSCCNPGSRCAHVVQEQQHSLGKDCQPACFV